MENYTIDSTTVRVAIEATQDSINISVIALDHLGVDRPQVMAWGLTNRSAASALAQRLEQAILAGRAFGPATVRTDVNGRTYLSAASRVFGRQMNADLKRLGF